MSAIPRFFPGMLADIARESGMSVPPNPDGDFDREAYPHFHVYASVILGQPLSDDVLLNNARIVAQVSAAEIFTITPEQLAARGFIFQPD